MKTFRQIREELAEVAADDYQNLMWDKQRTPADKFGARGTKTNVLGQIGKHLHRARMDQQDKEWNNNPARKVTDKVKKDMVFRKKVLGQRGTVMGQRDRSNDDY